MSCVKLLVITMLSLLVTNISTTDPDAWMADLHRCGQIEAEGTYCNWSQTGYVDCIYHEKYWNFYSGGTNWTDCPKGTRCSCFKDNQCSMPKNEICQPPEVLPPFPNVFHLSYQKSFVYDRDIWIVEERDSPRVVKGVIKQDLKQKKVLHTEDSTSHLIQEENDGFIMYTWNNADLSVKCTRSQVKELQPYMPELVNYQMTGSAKAGTQECRTYYFQNGPLNSWAYELFQKWWKMVYDPATHTMLPQSYKYRYRDVDMGDTSAADDFVYKVHEVKETDQWFQIPARCSST